MLDLNVPQIAQATGTSNPTFFTMPVDLKIVGLTSDTTVVVFNNQPTQTFVMTVPFAPTNVILDPGGWILKEATGIQVAVKDGQIVPVRYELDQNFPNPFNPATTIRFGLAVRSRVQLEVFDVVGRRIAMLVDDIRGAGFYAEVWSTQVPSGTYFYRLQATPVDGAREGYTATKAMTVLH